MPRIWTQAQPQRTHQVRVVLNNVECHPGAGTSLGLSPRMTPRWELWMTVVSMSHPNPRTAGSTGNASSVHDKTQAEQHWTLLFTQVTGHDDGGTGKPAARAGVPPPVTMS
eukprot:1752925-Rhodomonas_salina.1